jgi:hypothetical protein
MVRARYKYAFNPHKVRFQSHTSTPLWHHLLHDFYSHTDRCRDSSSGDYLAAAARQPTSTALQTDLDTQEIAVQRRVAIERRVPERQLTRQSTWTCRFESNLEFSSSACSSQSWPIGGLLPGEEHGDVAWPTTQWCVHKSVTRHHCREVFAKDLGRRQTADLLHRFHWRRLPPDLCRRRLNYRSPNPIRSTNKSQIHHNTHDTRMR